MNRRDAVLSFVVQATIGAPLHAARTDQDLARLRVDLARIAVSAGGVVGVAVHHIESGRGISLDGERRFPMASLFKLALAVELLARVDAGGTDLNRTLVLQANHLRPGSGHLAKTFREPRRISIRDLLETMLIHSDNTATDLLWTQAGGSAAVMARLATLGIHGMSVDRPTGVLLAAAAGIGPVPADSALTAAQFDERIRALPRAQRSAGMAAFFKDDRDTTTPQALIALLLAIWRRQALSADRTALLLDIMARCETGTRRLKGKLPALTRVFHKTGTLRPGVTNDAGIISLPERAGHLAMAVLIRRSDKDLAFQERTIADLARAAYDHFEPGSRRPA